MNKNNIVITGFVTNTIKTFGKGINFGLAIGRKVGNEPSGKAIFKTGFINVKGNSDRLEVRTGDRIVLTGYLSFDFFFPKGSKKEVFRPIFIGTSVEKIN